MERIRTSAEALVDVCEALGSSWCDGGGAMGAYCHRRVLNIIMLTVQ